VASTSREDVRQVADPVVRAAGLELEDVSITPAGRRRVVRLVVDSDRALDLDAVAEVSRVVSSALDEADVFGAQAYTLEVSSPGVDRPLTEPRHWRRALRRLVAVELADGTTLTGRVVEADTASARLDVDGTVHELELGDVRHARVQVEFSRPAGPDGDDPGDEEPDDLDGGDTDDLDGEDTDDLDGKDTDDEDDDDEGDDVSQDLPEGGRGALTANDVVGPEIDENAGRGDDEQITDLVDEDPDTTDAAPAPVSDEVGTGTERSGADVIGLDADLAEDDPVELVVGPGVDDDPDRPVEDDLTDGETEDGTDQQPLDPDDDDDPTDLSLTAAREVADEGPVEGSVQESGLSGDPRA